MKEADSPNLDDGLNLAAMRAVTDGCYMTETEKDFNAKKGKDYLDNHQRFDYASIQSI
jgi:hypothetical protein